MSHLRAIGWRNGHPPEDGSFPFGVPAIRTITTTPLSSVTFFVGENGSGKSTLLEGIAAAAGLPTVGSAEAASDESLNQARRLGKALRLTWSKRTHRGFFLRAEDFFGFQKRVAQQQRDLRARLDQVDATYHGRSEAARGLAKGPASGQLADIARRYGENPDGRSHGEAFLNLFQGRLAPGGLYLLDEPEAALSPQSQLAFLALLFDALKRDAQFVIATHSPMILAFPQALILSFDRIPVATVPYEELDHVRLTRQFLNHPDRFLRELARE